MANVKLDGKLYKVSDDPGIAKAEIEVIKQKGDYAKLVEIHKTPEEIIRTMMASLPSEERKKAKRTPKEIEATFKQCKENIKNLPDGWLGVKGYFPPELAKIHPYGILKFEYCETLRKYQEIKNKVIDALENGETSKSISPDPIPSQTPIPTVQPKTKETKSVENGKTVSVTKAVEEPPKKEKPIPPISTSSGSSPVASTQPAVYHSEAKTNKVSEKVHIINTQKFSKKQQAETLNKVAEKLIPIESNIKSGGNQIISYEKDKHESIGSVINTFPSLRKDASGEFRPKIISVEGKGSFVNYSPVSYTEEVENTKFPCGTYSINVGNKYDLSIGAGGGNISTLGNMRIGANGRALISAAEEMNITSGNGNVNIRAGHNVSLKGDSLTLETPNQVVVNSNLGVSKNAIINGCAFIDGEVYLNHVTCPAEVQYTGGGIGSFGQLMTSTGINGDQKGGGGTAIIAYADVSYIKDLYNSIRAPKAPWNGGDKVPVLVLSDGGTSVESSAGNKGSHKNPEYSVFVLPHEHPFNNIPLSFTTGNEQMRARASVLNSGNIGTAAPIQHGYKTPTA
jgi:hypothetical protein